MKRLQQISIQLRGLFAVSFLRAMSSAIISPIIALYLKQFVSSDTWVSAVFLIANGISIFGTLYASYIIEKLQRRKTMVIGLVAFACTFIIFSFATHTPTILFFFILYTFLFIILQFNIIVYIDHFSSQATLGKWYGSNGVITNLGWLIGPFLGGLIATSFSYIAVFLLASLFAIIALLIFIFSEPQEKKSVYHHQKIFQAIKPFIRNAFLRRTFIVGFGVNMLYGVFLLLPLYFTKLTASVTTIGIFLGISAIPWIILELPVGIWADRTKKEPKLFIACYILLCFLLPLFGIVKVPLMAFILLCGMTMATALVEASVVSYFYRHIKESEITYAGVFMTHPSIGLFIGSLFSTVFLLFLPIGRVFIFLAIPMALILITAISLNQSKKN